MAASPRVTGKVECSEQKLTRDEASVVTGSPNGRALGGSGQ